MLINVWDNRKRWLLHKFPLHISWAGSYRERWNAEMCHRRFLRRLVWNHCTSTFNHWIEFRLSEIQIIHGFCNLSVVEYQVAKIDAKIRKCSSKRVIRPRSCIGRSGLVVENVRCRYVQFDEPRDAIMKWFGNSVITFTVHMCVSGDKCMCILWERALCLATIILL